MEKCNLVDLKTSNGLLTWNNMRGGLKQIASRLDMFIVLDSIVTSTGLAEATILPLAGSYHWPICLIWSNDGTSAKRPVRFEKFCLTHHDLLNTL